MFTIAIRIDTFLHSFSMLLRFYNRIRSHTRPIKSYKETSSRRISTILSMRDSLVYSILLFIIKILLEYTSTTLLAERYESCFLFTFIIIILMENASFSLFFLFLKLRPQQLKNNKKVLLISKITQEQSRLFCTSNYLSSLCCQCSCLLLTLLSIFLQARDRRLIAATSLIFIIYQGCAVIYFFQLILGHACH